MPQQMLYFKTHYLLAIWQIGGFFTVILLLGVLAKKHSYRKIEKLKASNKAKLLSKSGL